MPQRYSESVSDAQAQGGRSYQEDRLVNELVQAGTKRCRVMAVFDGHGGDATAKLASKLIPDAFLERLRARRKTGMSQVMREVVADLVAATSGHDSGSTLSLVCVPEPFTTAYFAVLGDSPLLIATGSRQILAPVHNVGSNPAEREAAVGKGAQYFASEASVGYVGDGSNWTQVSRSLGDKHFDWFLNREPDVGSVGLTKQSNILVASDGLWRPGEPSQSWIFRMTAMLREGHTAEDFVEDGLKQYGDDNVTAVVWHRSA